MKRILLFALLLALVLTGCKAALSPMEQLLFPREEITEVSYEIGGHSRVGGVYVIANEEEQAALLDALFAIDPERFTDAEMSALEGQTLAGYGTVLLRSGDQQRRVILYSTPGGDTFLRIFEGLAATVTKKGPADGFDTALLDRLHLQIRANKEDPDRSALVEQTGREPDRRSKEMSALAKAYMDHTLTVDRLAPQDQAAFDVKVTFGDTVYRIETATRTLCREQDGQQSWGLMAAGDHTLVRINLGLN